MKIKDIGEFALIARIAKSVKAAKPVIKGIGDDCAVLPFNAKEYLLATSDMLVQDVDFTLKDDPLLIGRKALAVSLSDIAACSGLPLYALVSLAIPADSDVGFVDSLYRGINKIAGEFAVSIVGGDLSRAAKVMIDICLIGKVEKHRLVLRSGARPGDAICLTGKLGGSIKGRHLRFIPRVKEARGLKGKFKPSAMIDISDGLAADLGHIIEQSKVGAVVYTARIPQDKACCGLQDALTSGEDFELLFTLAYKKAQLLEQTRCGISIIGLINSDKGRTTFLDANCRKMDIKRTGYQHF